MSSPANLPLDGKFICKVEFASHTHVKFYGERKSEKTTMQGERNFFHHQRTAWVRE